MKENIINVEFKGLNCGDCAREIEEKTNILKGVKEANLNFLTNRMKVVLEDDNKDEILNEIIKLAKNQEPNISIKEIYEDKNIINLELEALNCGDCTRKILERIEKLDGVLDVDFNFLTTRLKVEFNGNKNKLTREIKNIVNEIEPSVNVKNLDERHEDIKIKIDKKNIFTLAIGLIIALIARNFEFGKFNTILFLSSYLILGHETIIQGFKNILNREALDENFLMTIATLAAIFIGEYNEAIMVMFLNNLGEIIEGMAVNDSRESIKTLMEIRPDTANLFINGEFVETDPEIVSVGDLIQVRPGERVALDGIVKSGEARLDTSSITGESLPVKVYEGEKVYSGSVNLDGLIEIEVEKEFNESTVSEILRLVEDTASNKAPTESFITRFSKYYTPAVVFLAITLFVVTQILGLTIRESIYRASVFLVISCPCALVISVPLSYFGGLGRASKEGILVKGGNYLEEMAHINTLVFDKTGTVTEGVFKVREIYSYGIDEEELLEIAAIGESHSNHPIGQSIVNRYGKFIDQNRITEYKEIAGKGLSLKIDNKDVKLGNKQLMDQFNINVQEINSTGTIVYIAEENKHIGTIIVSDKIKDNAKEALDSLKKMGIKDTVMLSGDNEGVVKDVAEKLDIEKAYGNLLPQDKVTNFEEIISENKNLTTAFIGDGINDAPVLARADIGIAMGALGSDAAIEASDIVIMTDDLLKIPKGIEIAKNTRKIVIQNIVFILAVKAIVLGLGAFGKATMWQAVFADVGVSIIAIGNSLRALNNKR